MPIIKTLKNGQWVPCTTIDNLPLATQSNDGLMSSADKSKLDNIDCGSTYVKFYDGTMIQWASTESETEVIASGAVGSMDVTMSNSFYNNDFIVFFAPRRNGHRFHLTDSNENGIVSHTNNTFKVTYCNAHPTTSLSCKFMWVAIGRWK